MGVAMATAALVIFALGRWACAVPEAPASTPVEVLEEADSAPAFCKKLDPKEVYLWGAVQLNGKYQRAFSKLSDPKSFCAIGSAHATLPSLRADGRMAYVGTDGKTQRIEIYEPGKAPTILPSPKCAYRFVRLEHAGNVPHYGCEIYDDYGKEWNATFFYDDGKLIGRGRMLRALFGAPAANGTVIARSGGKLELLEIADNAGKPLEGLPAAPSLVRPVGKEFLAVAGKDAALYRIDRDGVAKELGRFAKNHHRNHGYRIGFATTGELYEMSGADKRGQACLLVKRTFESAEIVYDELELRKDGAPYVRADWPSSDEVKIVTAR